MLDHKIPSPRARRLVGNLVARAQSTEAAYTGRDPETCRIARDRRDAAERLILHYLAELEEKAGIR